MPIPAFRILVLISAALFAAPVFADDVCPKFMGTPEFDEAKAMIERGEFAYAEDVIFSVFSGRACTREEMTTAFVALGFRYMKPNAVLVGRKGVWRENGSDYNFDDELGFCYPRSFPWSLFVACSGAATIMFLNQTISYIEIGAQI